MSDAQNSHIDENQIQQRADMVQDYITALDEERRGDPDILLRTDPDVVAMAARLHGMTSLSANEPDPQFVSKLEEQLSQVLNQAMSEKTKKPRSSKQSSRRTFIAGSLSAAAGIAVGATGAAVYNHLNAPQSHDTKPIDVALVEPEKGTWQPVATVSQVPIGAALQFGSDVITGYLIHQSDGSFLAISAACTHMGCLIQWQEINHTFECPCHNGRFDDQGVPLATNRIPYRPLPRLQVQVENDIISVFLIDTSSEPNGHSY
jgi:cytochrome b6-f complex iron-sulfur subunit